MRRVVVTQLDIPHENTKDVVVIRTNDIEQGVAIAKRMRPDEIVVIAVKTIKEWR